MCGYLFKVTLCLWKDVEHGWMVLREGLFCWLLLFKQISHKQICFQTSWETSKKASYKLCYTYVNGYFYYHIVFAIDIAINFSNKLRKYRTQLHLFMSKKSKLDAYCLAWKTLYVCIPLLLQMVPFKLGVSQSPLIHL